MGLKSAKVVWQNFQGKTLLVGGRGGVDGWVGGLSILHQAAPAVSPFKLTVKVSKDNNFFFFVG